MPAAGEAGGGLLDAVRRIGSTLLAAVQTRLELLSTETEEQLIRIARLWVLSACALLLLTVGLLVATAFVLILFWDTHRLAAAGLLALAYLGGGVALALQVRREARMRRRPFAASVAALREDREHLQGRP